MLGMVQEGNPTKGETVRIVNTKKIDEGAKHRLEQERRKRSCRDMRQPERKNRH